MSDTNKDVVRQFLSEIINKKDPDARPDLLATDFVAHFGGMPALDLAAWKQMALGFFAGFPDLSMNVDDMVAEGDRVAARWTWTGTHQGELMGLAPTGKSVTATGMGFYRVVDGRIAEEWVLEDIFGVMQQLGAAPS